jgi:putative peptidoglycan lipid II flippase
MIHSWWNRWTVRLPNGWIVIGGVTAVNLLLAAVSFVKDIVFAGYFGTSAMADAVSTAFLLPDAISGNLFAYVIGIASVPFLTRLWASGLKENFILSIKVLTSHCMLVMIALVALLWFFREPILGLFGTSGVGVQPLEHLFILLVPSMLFFPLSAIGGAALQAVGSFYVPSLGPVIVNCFILTALAAAWAGAVDPFTGSWLYSGSIVIGTGFAAAVTWGYLVLKVPGFGRRKSRERSTGRALFARLRLKLLLPVYRDIGPLFLIILFTQGLYSGERILASHGPTGTLAGLNYAYRIAQFPNWVFITALTSVILPALSRSAGSLKENGGFYRSLWVTLLVMIPASLVLCLGREQVVSILFGRGAFGPESVEITSGLLAGYSISVIGQAFSAVCLRYFLANGGMMGPVYIYLLSGLSALSFDAFFLNQIGPAALGFGALLGWSLNAMLMFWFVLRDSKGWRGLS